MEKDTLINLTERSTIYATLSYPLIVAVEQPLSLNTRTLSFNKNDNFTNSI